MEDVFPNSGKPASLYEFQYQKDNNSISAMEKTLRSYTDNNNLIELSLISAINDAPLASRAIDKLFVEYAFKNAQSIDDFLKDPELEKSCLKANGGSSKIKHYLKSYMKHIFEPFVPSLRHKILIQDDMDIYMHYFAEIHRNIDLISQQRPFQLDVYVVPSKYSLSKKKKKGDIQLDSDHSMILSGDDIHLLGAQFSAFRQSIDRDTTKHKVKRVVMVIDRHFTHEICKDQIYLFIPRKKRTLPKSKTIYENSQLSWIYNSKGDIIDGLLKSNDCGVLNWSFHCLSSTIQIYLNYGRYGSKVFNFNFRSIMQSIFDPSQRDFDRFNLFYSKYFLKNSNLNASAAVFVPTTAPASQGESKMEEQVVNVSYWISNGDDVLDNDVDEILGAVNNYGHSVMMNALAQPLELKRKTKGIFRAKHNIFIPKMDYPEGKLIYYMMDYIVAMQVNDSQAKRYPKQNVSLFCIEAFPELKRIHTNGDKDNLYGILAPNEKKGKKMEWQVNGFKTEKELWNEFKIEQNQLPIGSWANPIFRDKCLEIFKYPEHFINENIISKIDWFNAKQIASSKVLTKDDTTIEPILCLTKTQMTMFCYQALWFHKIIPVCHFWKKIGGHTPEALLPMIMVQDDYAGNVNDEDDGMNADEFMIHVNGDKDSDDEGNRMNYVKYKVAVNLDQKDKPLFAFGVLFAYKKSGRIMVQIIKDPGDVYYRYRLVGSPRDSYMERFKDYRGFDHIHFLKQ